MFSIPSKNSRVPDSRPYTHFSSLITGQIPRKYKSAKTIAAAIEKGAARGDIMNDFKTLGPRDELCITVTLSRCSVVGLYLDIFRRMIFFVTFIPRPQLLRKGFIRPLWRRLPCGLCASSTMRKAVCKRINYSLASLLKSSRFDSADFLQNCSFWCLCPIGFRWLGVAE